MNKKTRTMFFIIAGSLICILFAIGSLNDYYFDNSSDLNNLDFSSITSDTSDISVPALTVDSSTSIRDYFLKHYTDSSPEEVYKQVSKISYAYQLKDDVLIDTKNHIELAYPIFIKNSDSGNYFIISLSRSGCIQESNLKLGTFATSGYIVHDKSYEVNYQMQIEYTLQYSIVYDSYAQTISVWSFDKLISSVELPLDTTCYCGYSLQYGYVFLCDTRVISVKEKNYNNNIPIVFEEKLIAEDVQQVIDMNYNYSTKFFSQILLLTTSGETKVLCNGELIDLSFKDSYN